MFIQSVAWFAELLLYTVPDFGRYYACNALDAMEVDCEFNATPTVRDGGSYVTPFVSLFTVHRLKYV